MTLLSWLERYTQQAVVSVKELVGQTACSYCVTLENGWRYVLRNQTSRATSLGVDYRQEAAVLDAVAPLQFAPTVAHADYNGAILHWQEGQTLTQYNEANLKQLAEHLARLHNLPLQAVHSVGNIAKLDLAERCQFLWQHIPNEIRVAIPMPRLPKIAPFAQALCHHDLHLGNLLEENGKVIVIDWEYAAISDPALDIALFFQDPQLTSADKAYFLTYYLRLSRFKPSPFAQKMLEYQPYIKHLAQLWSLI